jgi:hypothetical protein
VRQPISENTTGAEFGASENVALGAPSDHDERLIWRMLGRLESLALRKYELILPLLATPGKKAMVDVLAAVPDGGDAESTPLDQPVGELLDAASSNDRTDTLFVQGFVLERLGQVIYKKLATHPAVSHSTRVAAEMGSAACTAIIGSATDLIRQAVGEGEVVFDRFCIAADLVLRRLDGVGSGVDTLFGRRFGLTFTELIGEFTAELLPACTDLGMNRRKLVCHLAGVFMGG